MSNIALKIENISKCYRIGLKNDIHDSFAQSLFNFIKSPYKNYRKYRSLYKFDDIKPDENNNPSDIIWALRDISFEVKKGEIVGIIGVNGAGKSTLLKILSRITDPTGGRAEIRGRISSLLEVGTGFHPELTGRENVYLNGTILGMRKKEVDSKFDEIVDFSGVEKFIDTPVKRYSSGMKVRLAFAVAAHLEPEILLIDEVLAVGDAQFQKKCLNKMEEVGGEGRTVFFVSHNLPSITRLCPRTILLYNGKVLADGPSHQVVSAYMNAGKGTRAEREWPDLSKAPGNDIVRLHAVRVKTKNNKITDTVDIREPISIEMEYEVFQPGEVLAPHFVILNEEGIIVFITLDLDPSWRKRPRLKGRYVCTALIPGNFLSEGTLFVSPVISTFSPHILHLYEPEVIAFQVVDSLEGNSARGDYAKPMLGVVRPLLEWTTQFTPNG